MRIEKITLAHYRNLLAGTVEPCGGTNILFGENGQGKTNWMESVWMCTGAKSFRGCNAKELIAFDWEGPAQIENHYQAFGRQQSIRLSLGNQKLYEQNQVRRPFAQIAGQFFAVAFTPDHLTLVSEGPEVRRRFLDATLCQFQPGYLAAVSRYKKALVCKNALLRRMADGDEHAQSQMDGYEQMMAEDCCVIIARRGEYLQRLCQRASAIYASLSGSRESILIRYQQGVKGESVSDFAEAFQSVRVRDSLVGYQTRGIHKDDFLITINEKEARKFASQGQKRSIVLAIKLAEADLLEESTGEAPVVLLDDVLSELDSGRQDYLLNHLGNRQLFITLCDKNAVKRIHCDTEHRLFAVKQGKITIEESDI